MALPKPLQLLLLLSAFPRTLQAAAGTEGASFLDIPVGAGPSGLGSAYSARADDAYAPVWNPAGLGRLECPQLAATHQPYLESVRYDYLGYVHPLGLREGPSGRARRGLGLSVQYLGSGNLDARHETGASMGTFSSYFAAYSLAYGQRWDHWALGVTAKAITAKISDASAKTGAADLGLLYQPSDRLSLGAAAANLGPDVKFADEGDPLPAAMRLGGYYTLRPDLHLSVEGAYRRTGLLSGSIGAEYLYENIFAVRGGYNTAHTQELSAFSGFTAGFGIFLRGQEFSYAWVPFGSLGTSHYFSLVLRFTRAPHPHLAPAKAASETNFGNTKSDESGYGNLYDMLNPDELKSIKKKPTEKEEDPEP